MELSVVALVRRSGGHCLLPPRLSYGFLELVGGDVRNLVHFLLHHSVGNRHISRNAIVDLTFRWRSKKILQARRLSEKGRQSQRDQDAKSTMHDFES